MAINDRIYLDPLSDDNERRLVLAQYTSLLDAISVLETALANGQWKGISFTQKSFDTVHKHLTTALVASTTLKSYQESIYEEDEAYARSQEIVKERFTLYNEKREEGLI